MTYSFIFVNYQSASILEGSIRLLKRALGTLSYEILIINNDPRENETLSALSLQYEAKVSHLGANFGFGRANNVGAKKAQGEILFFLNPDASILSGNFLSLQAAFRLSPHAIYGMRLMTPNKKDEPWSKGSLPTLLSLLMKKLVKEKKEVRSTGVKPVDWVSGAAFAVRKETFDSLGGFDERFFLYYEDVDFFLRAGKKNFPVYSYPFLSFLHKRGQSHSSYREMKDAYFISQKLYFEKHGTWLEKKLLSFLQPLYRFFFI